MATVTVLEKDGKTKDWVYLIGKEADDLKIRQRIGVLPGVNGERLEAVRADGGTAVLCVHGDVLLPACAPVAAWNTGAAEIAGVRPAP